MQGQQNSGAVDELRHLRVYSGIGSSVTSTGAMRSGFPADFRSRLAMMVAGPKERKRMPAETSGGYLAYAYMSPHA